MSAGFDKLSAHFTKLVTSPESKTDDDLRSLRYFDVDSAHDEDRVASDPSPRIHDWIDKVRRLEHFICAEGRLPVENRRKERSEISDEERTLAQWKGDQLRAARRTPLCNYQIQRLEGLEGFRWTPLEDRWDEQFAYYEAFATARQVPRYRAGGTERQVARWAQRQRDQYRRGALPQSRIDRLEATRFWTW